MERIILELKKLRKKTMAIGTTAIAIAALSFQLTAQNNMQNVDHQNVNEEATTTWVFMGDELADVSNFNSTNYQQNPAELPEGCGEGNDLPCQYIVPASITTVQQLENYLISNHGSNPEDLKDAADTQRSE